MSLEFLATSMVVILLPGTGVLYTLSVGLGKGFRSGIVAAFGCTLGTVPHVLASVVGWRPCCTPARWRFRPSNIWASPTCSIWPGYPA